MALIVNADDFGISDEITDAIVISFDKGFIDRTTIMVNMPATQYAVNCAKKNELMNKVGLHLNLSTGYPLTESIKNDPLFCDPMTKLFNRAFHQNKINRFILPKSSMNVLKKEIEAQIECFESYGFTLRHLDSHHHVHTDYSILSLVLPVLEKKKWNTIRILKNTGSYTIKKRMYVPFINNTIDRSKIDRGSDYLYASIEEAQHATIALDKNIEIEVHPQIKNGIIIDHQIELQRILDIRNNY